MTFLTSIILVPLTTAKCLLSLLTFCLGIVNTMKTDRLQEKRGVGTSTFKNVRDLVMTVILSVIPLAGIVFHIGFLIMTSMIAVFSWSWTEESPQPHHFYNHTKTSHTHIFVNLIYGFGPKNMCWPPGPSSWNRKKNSQLFNIHAYSELSLKRHQKGFLRRK